MRFLVVAMAGVTMTTPSMAQQKEIAFDYQRSYYWFIGVSGGVQSAVNLKSDNLKTLSPTAAISLGRMFSSAFGARLNVNGIWSKSAASNMAGDTDFYKYNYTTTSIDVMPNIVSFFSKKDYNPVNLYFIAGAGWAHAWNDKEKNTVAANGYNLPYIETTSRDAVNARLGLQLEANLSKHLALNLEGNYNFQPGQKWVFDHDYQKVNLMAGLTYKFSHKKVARNEVNDYIDFSDTNVGTDATPAKLKDYEVVIDTIWYDDVEYKDVQKSADIDKRIFFNIAQSNIEDTDAQISAVAEFLKGVQDGQVTITSYADRGTGNPTINMRYSKQRAEKTRQALIDRGVDPSIIKSVEWKGDTVQPYPDDNDKNRVSIITGRGVSKQQEKYTVKRFKLQEKKVRVQ